MRRLHASLLLYFLLTCVATATAEDEAAEADTPGNQGYVMPYWNLWSSDFWGWVEELRAQGAYDQMNDLARTFWAHFPSTADRLGYGQPPEED